MAHPIVGLWQVVIDIDGKQTHVTHVFHADGVMHVDADSHGASQLWEATGERSFRIHGTRPIEPEIFEFVGWQYADGVGEVSEDGSTYTMSGNTDSPQSDGSRVKRHVRLQGTRVTLDSRR